MGSFDIVKVPCPKCGAVAEFQSKGGQCMLEEYDLENAPADVLMDINRHSPYTCRCCSTEFEVDVKIITTAKSIIHKKYNDN